MKKILLTILIILFALIFCVDFFIPTHLIVANTTILKSSTNSINRTLQNKEKWKKFWIGYKEITPLLYFTNDDIFVQNGDTFRITQQLLNNLKISISNKTGTKNSVLSITPLSYDSIALNWSFVDTSSWNPFSRLQKYNQAVSTKKNITTVLNWFKKYAIDNKNIYGIPIKETSIKDTLLISIDSIIFKYPSTTDIYNLIKQLQLYAVVNNAAQTSNAMLNINRLDSQTYKILVGLPINKKLPEKGKIQFKQLIPGKFLKSSVIGGNQIIYNASLQMQKFIQDYQRSSIAIPFQVLITDRTKITDTAKWVTDLYFPVM